MKKSGTGAMLGKWDRSYPTTDRPQSPPSMLPRFLPQGNTLVRLSTAQDRPVRPCPHALTDERHILSIFQPSEEAHGTPPFSKTRKVAHAAGTLLRLRSSIPSRLCRKPRSLSMSLSRGAVMNMASASAQRRLFASRCSCHARGVEGGGVRQASR